MRKAERRGASNLRKPDAPTTKAKPRNRTCVIRYWFETQSGEIVHNDSEPLTCQMATNRKWELTNGCAPNDFLAVAVVSIERPVVHDSLPKSRAIVFPSQVPA